VTRVRVRAAFSTLILVLATNACTAFAQSAAVPRSGITFAGPDVRALQADDFQNPGMLWVERGARLWRDQAGAANSACASCHGDAGTSMRGVATRYPKHDAALGRVVNLEGRINACRVTHQRAKPWTYESDELLASTAYVAHQSRGMPLSIDIEAGAMRALHDRGRALYTMRMGQMNFACTQCHDGLVGRRLLAETISEGHPNAYPIYRLEWQTVGSLQRRLRACLSGIRAEMWPYGADEYLALEVFLAGRARGLAMETPGVRR
jgi:L-cysteine S-thiosulfotransferase